MPTPDPPRPEERPLLAASSQTELFRLIKQKRWTDVASRARAVPGEATFPCPTGPDARPLPPLHLACALHPPPGAIRALLCAHPPAICQRHAGDLPLHVACREMAPAGAIRALIAAHPGATREKDAGGRLPVHLACREWTEKEVVEGLLTENPHGAGEADDHGFLPLHWACARNASAAVVAVLLRVHPNAREKKDEWGRIPMTLLESAEACENRDLVRQALKGDSRKDKLMLMDEQRDDFDVVFVPDDSILGKAETLENKLMQVTATTCAAAKGFRELRDGLTADNSSLRMENKALRRKTEAQSKDLQELKRESSLLRMENEENRGKMNELMVILSGMEEQRHQILKMTGKWEDTLREAKESTLVQHRCGEKMNMMYSTR